MRFKTRLLFSNNIARLGFETSNMGLVPKKYLVNVNNGDITKCENVVVTENNNSNKNKFIELNSTPGTFSITPASRITSRAVAISSNISGNIIDWGCGGGLLALIAASKQPVKNVIGLDYDSNNIKQSIENAKLNNLSKTVHFFKSDSFEPFDHANKSYMESLKGKIDCIVANPPASSFDDGFNFRRRIINEAKFYLKDGGSLILQALSYYGINRFICGAKQASKGGEYIYNGIIASSEWVKLGEGGYDMRKQLEQYVYEEEKIDGERYYCGPKNLTATEVYEDWNKTGVIPECKWAVHELVWTTTSKA